MLARHALSTALLTACAVALLGACASTRAVGPTVPAGPLSFDLLDLDGKSVSAERDLRGRVVLVDIWATWCTPCEASFPFYAELYRRHQERGFDLVAISVDAENGEVARFLERHPVPFKILRDPGGKVPAMLDAKAMPTAVLLDRDGRVVYVHAGFESGDQAEIEAAVQKLLAAAGR
ncbi:MAG: TlpA family protein disulfide reductase [Deltaproteobacteria bacterium]|nr:TlpA family protein disulfide reductase [Deltaproteobacteria bacterium]